MLTTLSASVAVVLAAFAVWADVAAACSCADQDERDRLEDGERAIVGRVVSERPLDENRDRVAYRVRVERSVGVRLRGEIELGVRFDECGSPRVGARQGLFIRRAGAGWVTDGCSIVEATDMGRALKPYARPLGSGRAALLAAGRFGDARVMALDARGRVLGYGLGRGATRTISVCPGAARMAEVAVSRRGAVSVAVRDLASLDVVRTTALPIRIRPLDPVSVPLRCADAEGAVVHAAFGDYVQHTRFDRMRIFRVDAAGAHRVALLEGSQAALGGTHAYVSRYGEAILAVDLATGATRHVTRARGPDLLTLGPDGTRLAFYDSDRLRLVDVATGQERSRRISYGGGIEWLDAERLVFRRSGTALLYDTELRRLRRYGFVRMVGQAHVAGRLYGTARYRLRSLNLETGRKRTVAQLTDRGIAQLVAVPGRPAIQPGTRRPARPPGAASRAAARDRCR